MANEEYAYIGVKACGCVPCVMVDAPDYRDRIAEVLPEWINKGLNVERVTVEAARKRIQPCRCNQQLALAPEQEATT